MTLTAQLLETTHKSIKKVDITLNARLLLCERCRVVKLVRVLQIFSYLQLHVPQHTLDGSILASHNRLNVLFDYLETKFPKHSKWS